MRLKMRGTAIRIVGFTSARLPSKFGISSFRPSEQPTLNSMCSSQVCPNACAQGKNASERSVARSGKISPAAITLLAMFQCVSTTPLGAPVVPEV